MGHVRTPDWWAVLLLAGASFRMWRLLAEDTIFDTARRRLMRLPTGWVDGDPIPPEYRAGWAEWLTCGWCSGLFVSAGWLAAWYAWEDGTTTAAALLTISAAVGFAAEASGRDGT
jgi:hypothetical protein